MIRSSFLVQCLMYACVVPLLLFITRAEWEKLGFLNFSNAEAEAYVVELVDRIPEIPQKFGDWEYYEEAPMDASQIGAANIKKYFSQRFRNSSTQEEVTLLLATGPTKDMCIHTPEECFPGGGMTPTFTEPLVKEIKSTSADGKEKNLGTFLWQRYKDQRGADQDTWWSFSENGMWQGERSPRTVFASPALYKIYVMSQTSPGAAKTRDESPQQSFLRQALPILNPILYPADDAPKVEPASVKPIPPARST